MIPTSTDLTQIDPAKEEYRKVAAPSFDDIWPDYQNRYQIMMNSYRQPNMVLKWYGFDSEQRFEQNRGHYLYDADSIEYRFNQYGYRGEDFRLDERFILMSVGCSNTEGIGLPQEHTYSSRLASLLGTDMYVMDMNLGQGGASNQKIAARAYRMAVLVKPDFLILQWTFPARRLYVQRNGYTEDWWNPSPDEIEKRPIRHRVKLEHFESVQNEHDDFTMTTRIIRFLNAAMRYHEIPVLNVLNFLSMHDYPRYAHSLSDLNILRAKIFPDYRNDYARDHSHPGPKFHESLAQAIFEETPWESL